MDDDAKRSAAHGLAAADDVPTNPRAEVVATIGDVIDRRFGRRGALKALFGTAAGGLAAGLAPLAARSAHAAAPAFDFEEIAHGVDGTHHVAPGYAADILIRWGDPLRPDAPPFDPYQQSAEAQAVQFGYNNDFVGYIPLALGAGQEARGLLCVNHEYTIAEAMFPGRADDAEMSAELVAIEMAAHGGSIVEVVKRGGGWAYVRDSRFNRRVTAGTPMVLSGPAAGHRRLQTSADRSGRRVIGTFNNCAGGITPWGTYLMAEENFNGYFAGELSADNPEARNHARCGVPGGWYAWSRFDPRFDIGAEPREPNRFGWVVEVDAFDPRSTPKKRTALGRFKHEGAEPIVNKDGRVVVYMGDDQRFDYIYKFVSRRAHDPDDRRANMDLLDEGTLYVARFDADGTVAWLALVHGEGPLTAANGFADQAEVLIEARRAGDLLGATPMDRPEDVQVNPRTGKVYAMLTNNTGRTAEQVEPANPRAANRFGHIIEITAPDMDFAATRARWEVLIRCGDPARPEVGALWNPATSAQGWFANPDNCALDHQGRLWVTTDQGAGWQRSGTADGVWAVETEGPLRGTGRMFFRVPVGAEMCGPCFTPDDRALFVAVQHVAMDGVENYAGFERASTFEDPATRWPDFDPAVPPRPSVVAITRKDGGRIGG